ncbi:hypothetical protein DY240_04195 [Jiangella rhizosphaerae]|uniref:Integrase catalytic domain-containing protein n=1 Tax=Jiangella rhizosphaerae TaxID=2293569 RepID=A0A418KW67_9ACTN|nr:hypothetical protein DY240_04195 [Jiangella rhizosphaerae]
MPTPDATSTSAQSGRLEVRGIAAAQASSGPANSFNGRLRDECLNIHLFWSRTHTKVTIGDWKEEYDHDRAHSSVSRHRE